MLLKELIKKGETSPADVRSADYDPKQFIHTVESKKKREKMRDKLENASMQFDPDTEDRVEEEYDSQDIGHSMQVDEDGIQITDRKESAKAKQDKESRGRKLEPEKKDKRKRKDEAATKMSESQTSA